jgi:alkaline phosphatase D
VGSVLFVSLDASDVVFQDSGPFVAGPTAFTPAAGTGNAPIEPGSSLYVRNYSGGAQTAWLEQTLAGARDSGEVDWIVVQMHMSACSSSHGNGSDLGIRAQWLPLFDRYQVDLVVNGHDHDYERSFPVRGYDSDVGTEVATGATVQTLRPHPVTTTDTGTFDTSQGTVYLVLGGGGTNDPTDTYETDTKDGLRQAKVFTRPNNPVLTTTADVYARAAADAVEDAIWSANRDPATGYGIAVFDVDPGAGPAEQTSITVTYFHAVGADGTPVNTYTQLETFTLTRPRSDA